MIVVLLAMSAVTGVNNIVSQTNILGEFENWPHEQVICQNGIGWLYCQLVLFLFFPRYTNAFLVFTFCDNFLKDLDESSGMR